MTEQQQGPATAGPSPGYRLNGPAHAHRDAPCGPECYEPIPPTTPELDKQSVAIKNGAHRVGEFLDWLDEQGYVLARSVEDEDWDAEILTPATASKQDLVAAFYEIDLNKIEAERQSLLEYLRSLNS